AEKSAQHSLDLLATVGADMPRLPPSVLRHGLSPVSTAELASAVRTGQQQGLLSSLTIWNADHRVIYSNDGELSKRTSAMLAGSLAKALSGHSATIEVPSERDLASHMPTGTLV